MQGVVVIDNWLMSPAPAVRLAMFRIMIGVFSAGYFVARLPTLLELGDEPRVGWEPVGVLWWLVDPLPRWLVRCAVIATIALAVASATGVAFRVVGPAFAIGLLFVTTYRSSGGQLLWFDNLLVLHAIVIACSPAGDALRLGRRGESRRRWPALWLAAPRRCHRHGCDVRAGWHCETADRRDRLARWSLAA